MTQTAAELAAQHDRPAALVQTKEFRESRPQIVGPDSPESPFPIYLEGIVQRGFGRGGKDLGCPTANLPDESISPLSSVTETGVYYGYAQVVRPKDGKLRSGLREEDYQVFPMVMSLGWNPFYKNEKLTAEIHIMHAFEFDFYGSEMKALVLGYIRPELDYTSRGEILVTPLSKKLKQQVEALIDDIETDKKVALNCLARSPYQAFARDSRFSYVQ
ncbi:hypothetical protein AX16_000270 [Volvariella volvacea WC 439]|nr:hypothetical protein AX16_000270 [Volvariella volvacea WC 439]